MELCPWGLLLSGCTLNMLSTCQPCPCVLAELEPDHSNLLKVEHVSAALVMGQVAIASGSVRDMVHEAEPVSTAQQLPLHPAQGHSGQPSSRRKRQLPIPGAFSP